MDFYSQYQKLILDRYPETKPFFGINPWRHSVFPEIISVSSNLLEQMTQVVESVYRLKSEKGYLDFLKSRITENVKIPHPQDSVLMAYDFHRDSSDTLRLIEVNTNAAGFLIANAVYQVHGMDHQRALKDLIQSFRDEWRIFQKGRGAPPETPPFRTALVDEKPFQQKMLLEFFMYKGLFRLMGWPADIYDSSDLREDSKGFLTDAKGQRVDFIYNRSTDFYFRESPHLLRAYKNSKACFSPHPSEYGILSDKNRLCEWFLHKRDWPALRGIEKNLINSRILTEENSEEAWENRKNLFFKKAQGHAGRQTYRGKNLTRRKFQQLRKGATLFQDYIPPPTFQDSQGIEWKFDLRAYTYGKHIQQIVARCYKGQVTNFQEEGGGFAAVQFI